MLPIKLLQLMMISREFLLFYSDYNLSILLERVERFNQWTESLSGKYKVTI